MSADDGATWGNRQPVYSAKGIAAAPQVTNCGGKLVVTFQTDEEGLDTSIVMLVGRPGAWSKKMLVSPKKSSWAGILTLDESSVLVMFDNGGCKTRRITLR